MHHWPRWALFYHSSRLPTDQPSAYEKRYLGYPGIALSDMKPVGLWRHPEALRGSLKPSKATSLSVMAALRVKAHE